ncbi:MAG: YesL family protein [Lachnospiraceae bacterium]|nr:YesL family protein [Lachnospiraceae bacterium]
MKFLNLDSPLMRGLSKMADLMWLNILTLVCCLPIVTAGASVTAMHFVLLKMVRDEDSYITKDFFRSFKQNFVQATIIWLMVVAVGAIMVFDVWYVMFSPEKGNVNTVFFAAIIVSGILYLCVTTFVFPILSHFVNSIGKTIKNALFMSILVFPKTVVMVVVGLIPSAAIYFIPQIIPLAVLFFFTGPGFVSALLYNKTFKRFEPEEEETVVSDMEWTVAAEEEGEVKEASDTMPVDEEVTEDSQDTQA